MPTTPKRLVITNVASEVLNVIREQATTDYKNYVPFAQQNAESIKAIGAIIMDSPNLRNEFLHALVNRIALVLINTMSFSNPWAKFKRGFIEFGETVEDVWIDIAVPKEFDPEGAETTVFARTIPDVKAAFHVMNYQKFYPTTVSVDQLKQAFLSLDGVINLANKISNTLYTAMEYDEFLTMRYMLARKVLDGQMYFIESKGALTGDDAKETLANLRALNNDLVFPSRLYNVAGVLNRTEIADQQIIIDGQFEAHVDVYALASAFNLNYADFMAKRILTPRFYFNEDELARLDVLFVDNPEYRPIIEVENEALHGVHALIVDDKYFMIFDNRQSMEDIYNPKGLYWNYFLHAWKTFSTSPFMNAVALVDQSVLNTEGGIVSTYTIGLTDMFGNPVEGTVLKTNTTYVINAVADDDTSAIPALSQIVGIESNNESVAVDVSRGIITTSTPTGQSEDITITVTFANGATGTLTFTVA